MMNRKTGLLTGIMILALAGCANAADPGASSPQDMSQAAAQEEKETGAQQAHEDNASPEKDQAREDSVSTEKDQTDKDSAFSEEEKSDASIKEASRAQSEAVAPKGDAGEMVSGSTAQLPPYHYALEGEPYMDSICQFMIENMGSDYEKADICIPVISVIDIDDSDKSDIRVYGDFWIYNYNRNGDILEMLSGGSYPGRISVDGQSNLVTDIEILRDGSDNDRDAIRIFGEREGALDRYRSEEFSDQREEDRRLQLKAYVDANSLDITAYKDYGWEPVALDGSSVKTEER